jgi:hypothetical protein
MENRRVFLFLVIVFIITPGIHYFVAGEHYDNSKLRNTAVVAQIIVGLVLIFFYGRKPKE